MNRSTAPAGLVAAAVLFACGSVSSAQATTYSFLTIDNKAGDVNFNQLLGINNNLEIVGYDGDGTVKPNKGYVLTPRDHYASENFLGSVQTQAIGINNHTPTAIPFAFTWVVGFWIDHKGNNFGFADVNGEMVSVSFPNTPKSGGITTNQLLGINDASVTVGFYNDAKGNSHGYTYNFGNSKFTALKLPFAHVVSFQATGINNAGVICGFYVDTAGTSHGFYGKSGSFKSVDATGAAGTVFLGINNKGMLVGSQTINNVSHGLLYNSSTKTSSIVDDGAQSSQPAFGVTGTTINGINDHNEIVGFFSDGEQVHGFLAAPSS